MQNYTTTQNGLILLARIMFSLIFILSGINKITAFDSTVTYMIGSGVTFEPNILAIIAVVFELGGGILLLLGLYARLAGALLFIFSLTVAVAIHHYWTYTHDQTTYLLQMINFMKNVTIAGGALYIVSFGAGRFSIDSLMKRKKQG